MYKKKIDNLKKIQMKYFFVIKKNKYRFSVFNSLPLYSNFSKQKLFDHKNFNLITSQQYIQQRNLNQSDFLLKSTPNNVKTTLVKNKKFSIDWHSKDLLVKNEVGLWFCNCFQPFSTRKYWWILLPSQTLLFRLRWESFSKLNVSHKSKSDTLNSATFKYLNWFNEKPLYIYWIIPFFGCLNIISLSFSKEIPSKVNNFETSKNYFEKNKKSVFNSEFILSQPIILSWETLNYLTYKKNLLDLSFKFIQKINYYHDSIVYEVSPSWFNYLQEQYIGTYNKKDDYDSILQNFQLLETNSKSHSNFLNLLRYKGKYKTKLELQNFHNYDIWWNQENWEKNELLNSLPFKKLKINTKKVNFNSSNNLQKCSLFNPIIPFRKKNFKLKASSLRENDFIWHNFLIQKSQFKWYWYNLVTKNNLFFAKNHVMDRTNLNLSFFFWPNNIVNFNNNSNILRNNLVQFSQNRTSSPQINSTFLSNFSDFEKLKFFTSSFDEFSKKMFIGNTSFPINYLFSKLSNQNVLKLYNSNLYLIFKQIQIKKEYKSIKFNLKKLIFPIDTKIEMVLQANPESGRINLNKNLIGINSSKMLINSQIFKTDFFLKFYSKNLLSNITYNKILSTEFFSSNLTQLDFLQNPDKTELKSSWQNFLNSENTNRNKKLEFFLKTKSQLYKKSGFFYNLQDLNSNFRNLYDFMNLSEKKFYFSDVFTNYLKASFIYDFFFYKLYLNIDENLIRNIKNISGVTKPIPLNINSTSPVNSNIFGVKHFKNNFFPLKLLKKNIYKLNVPLIMSGYLYPETSKNISKNNLFQNNLQVSLNSGEFFSSKQIKRTNGLMKIKIPPQVCIYDKIEKINLNNIGLTDNNLLKAKNNSILQKISSNKKIGLQKIADLNKNNLFKSKILNFENLFFTKEFLLTPKFSNTFLQTNKKLKSCQLKNKFLKQKEKNKFFSKLKLTPTSRFKYIGNWSFYWNYFKTFYGSSFVLKPFNGIIYSTNSHSFLSNSLQKIEFNRLLPGNNFLFKKWHPRKKEGFFYKRINKLNLKNKNSSQLLTKLSTLQSSKSEIKNIVELIWGFRAKYKLEEVLQYQKSKYYQSKKAQQTTIDQNENQLTNNSKLTLQTIIKTLIKRKRYKKLLRFEVLSSWLRDVVYLRKMSRKISLTKKDLYIINLSQALNRLNKVNLEEKYITFKPFFKQLVLDLNLGKIKSLNNTNIFSLNQINFSNHKNLDKLNLTLRNNRLINPFKLYFKKTNLSNNRLVRFKSYERWINNKKLLLFVKRFTPLKKLKFYSLKLSNSEIKRQKLVLKHNLLKNNFRYKSQNQNLMRSFMPVKNFYKKVDQYLISNQDSYLSINNRLTASNFSKQKKIYLNSSNNRILNINLQNRIFLNIKYLNSSILKDLNNYLMNFLNKILWKNGATNIVIKKNLLNNNSKTKINGKTETDLLRDTFVNKKMQLNNLKSNKFNLNQNKKQKLILNFYNISESSNKIFNNSKKFIYLLKPKILTNDSVVIKKPEILFKTNLLDFYKTSLKNNWIKKVYKTRKNLQVGLNTSNFYQSNKKTKFIKNENQKTRLTSIITKFRNFSASFVLWRNTFKIRQDYLLLAYIYLDYLGGLINSLLSNFLIFLDESTFFSIQNSKFIFLSNLKNIPLAVNQSNFTKISKLHQSQVNLIFPFLHERYYFSSQLYKNNLSKPQWSFLILNHIKRQHFDLYKKVIKNKDQKGLNSQYFFKMSSSQSSRNDLNFEKNRANVNHLFINQEKKIKQNLDSKSQSVNKINFPKISPSVVFYRSILDSYNTDSQFSNLLLENQKNYIPIRDSLVNSNLYINSRTQLLKKRIFLMEKQKKFHTFYVSSIRPFINFGTNTKISFKPFVNATNKMLTTKQLTNTKQVNSSSSSLVNFNFKFSKKANHIQPKLRRKTGVFKLRILDKKTKIYNGIYLPPLQFTNNLLLTTENTLKLPKNQLIHKKNSFSFLREKLRPIISEIQLNNFLLCTIIFHTCLIFSLLLIYKLSIHFCIKALYSSVFVLNKYFVYSKYRIHRLLKYIYQSNFQSIIEQIQQKYYENYILSFNSKLSTTFNFFFKRNLFFSKSSRFNKSTTILENIRQFSVKENQISQPVTKMHSIRFFQYLIQPNLIKITKSEKFLQKKTKISSFVSLLQAQKSHYRYQKSNKIFSFKNLLELENLNAEISIKNNKKYESKNLKLNFRVLHWNMFLTLLIGESEILSELEPYREMHWYFLKRFPIFLRTPAGKDPIGMVDYQADEKIRLIKQKIRQTVMILYLRSRKYESKLQNRSNSNEKSNQSFLKNRRKLSQWSKEPRIQKFQKTGVEAQTINKDSSLTKNISLLKSFIDFIQSKKLINYFKSFSSLKRRTYVRKISIWKSILTFLGKLSYVSRYTILNKRFRQSLLLFSKPFIFFGPFGMIFFPYLIKSFFLVFDSTTQFNPNLWNAIQNKRKFAQNQSKNFIQLTFQKEFPMKQIENLNFNNSHRSEKFSLNRHLFSKTIQSKLFQIYNLTLPFSKEESLGEILQQSSNDSFEKHLGNLNLYIRQKMQSFQNLNIIPQSSSQTKLKTNQFLNVRDNNRVPIFDLDFIINCQKLLNKYERIYISLNKIDIIPESTEKKLRLIKVLEESYMNSQKKITFKTNILSSNYNLLSDKLDIVQNNSKNPRFMHFETFDPKLRYYRFSTNFSKVLSDVGGIRFELSAHQQLGAIICKVYTGLFSKQSAKNYLLVSGNNKPESLLFIIQALAGEIGMKLFLEDAKRLQRIGRRGINKATKRLEKLFDIAQANTPCLVFIEDIHVIGSKTKMIKVDEEQEDEEILVRSLLSKLIYRKYHKNKSLRETFMDQNLLTSGSSIKRRRSLKPTNPIPKSLVLYQLTRRRALSNYFNSNSQFNRINSKLFLGQKLSTTFTTNAVLIWKLFKSKIATPDKRIKEAPWVHIPIDALRSIHPLTYSIRVKVAKITLLAIFTMGTRLRLVKDLIRLFEKTSYASHNNFVVFATTTNLAYLDPALRRPGRLEEIISLAFLTRVSSLVRSSSFQSQLDTFKTYLKNLPGFYSTFNLIDSTLFSANLNLKEWSVINYLAEDAYNLDMLNGTSKMNSNLSYFLQSTKQTFKKNLLIKEKYLNYTNIDNINLCNSIFQNSNNLTLKNNFNIKLKKQRLTNYETLKTLNTLENSQIIFSNIILNRKKGLFDLTIKSNISSNFLKKDSLVNRNVVNDSNQVLGKNQNDLSIFDEQILKKNQIRQKFDFSTYYKNKSSIFAILAYSQMGQTLISFLPFFSSKKTKNVHKNEIFFDSDNLNNLKLWPVFKANDVKLKNLFFNRRKNLTVYFLRFFSAKVGEFLFMYPIELNNLHNFNKKGSSFQSLNKAGFLQSIYGIQQNWSLAYSVVTNLITTNCLYSKTPLISKLLRIEDVNKPRQKQFFENLNAGILFEYSDFHYRTFLKKNVFLMEEHLNLLQSQKFLLNNQGRPLRKFVNLSINKRLWLFRSLFTELGSLDEIILRPTLMNYYYRNKIILKQKLKISSYQWLNWHLRKPLDQLEEIQDIAYFPCVDKYYNPRHRRWIITNGYWGYWFTFDKIFYDNLYEQYIFENFYKVYLYLDKNREILDYLSQLLITKETLSETELILSFKRYGF